MSNLRVDLHLAPHYARTVFGGAFMIKIDVSGIKSFVDGFALSDLTSAHKAHISLLNGTGAGAAFTGWVNLPEKFDRAEISAIKSAANRIVSSSDVLVVIGIGGSYLGSRAVIELLKSPFYNSIKKGTPDIYFVGNNMSGSYIEKIISLIGERDFSVNVISKSGTTMEPAIAFRIFKKLLEDKYGKDGARKRIYATTDREKGALKSMADKEGYETFVVPGDVGGRYSVLTSVGLLPAAAAGVDIEALLRGAEKEMKIIKNDPNNSAYMYANARQILYKSGKKIEILASSEPGFHYMTEWWKQLFGESEGKGQQGIFPAGVDFTTDLHSMGQYIQDGERIIMETLVSFKESASELAVPYDEENEDSINYVAGKTFSCINSAAMSGTKSAHISGGVPVMEILVDRIDEENIGALIYFFETACAISGYMSGINPFDQPGVEAYKKNMFSLLGRP